MASQADIDAAAALGLEIMRRWNQRNAQRRGGAPQAPARQHSTTPAAADNERRERLREKRRRQRVRKAERKREARMAAIAAEEEERVRQERRRERNRARRQRRRQRQAEAVTGAATVTQAAPPLNRRRTNTYTDDEYEDEDAITERRRTKRREKRRARRQRQAQLKREAQLAAAAEEARIERKREKNRERRRRRRARLASLASLAAAEPATDNGGPSVPPHGKAEEDQPMTMEEKVAHARRLGQQYVDAWRASVWQRQRQQSAQANAAGSGVDEAKSATEGNDASDAIVSEPSAVELAAALGKACVEEYRARARVAAQCANASDGADMEGQRGVAAA